MLHQVSEPDFFACPNCAEPLRPGAIVCRFCDAGISRKHFRPCPLCAEMIRKDASFCKICRSCVPIEMMDRGARSAARDEEPEAKMGLFQVDKILIRQRTDAIVKQLEEELDYCYLVEPDDSKEQEVRARIRQIVNADPAPLTMMERGCLLQDILDRLFGFGLFGPLLRDPSVEQLYVTGPDAVFVSCKGVMHKVAVAFDDVEHLRETVDKIMARFGIDFSETVSVVSQTLPNGSWVLAAKNPQPGGAPLFIIKHARVQPHG
jgi:hypothetical protein